tara:strand:- start:18 stop:857 length:840 start_codon:yes stop_codon:yes gene_type:complete
MKTQKLADGSNIPVIGLGTAGLQGEKCEQAIKWALEIGYRHIDSAWAYKNQPSIAQAIKQVGIQRKDLFITSKIWRDHLSYEKALNQCNEILDQLQMDYVDLLLTHWPSNANVRSAQEPENVIPLEETISAFNEIHKTGKAKHIGVSNYNINLIKQAQKISPANIAVNQVHFHLSDQNCSENTSQTLIDFCLRSNVMVTAYCPLASGWCPANGGILKHPLLHEIASKHNKTPAQIALRWVIERGVTAIPRSGSQNHLRENMEIFDFELSETETVKLNTL